MIERSGIPSWADGAGVRAAVPYTVAGVNLLLRSCTEGVCCSARMVGRGAAAKEVWSVSGGGGRARAEASFRIWKLSTRAPESRF